MTDTPPRDSIQEFATRIIAELENGVKPVLGCLRSADFQPCSPLQSDFAPAPGKQAGRGGATETATA
jgi:hypothetical protein